MSDLTDFLLARIAEDEAAARLALGTIPADAGWYAIAQRALAERSIPDGSYQHIARHDPARVLAECEAKRRIVHEFAVEVERGPASDRPDFVARQGGAVDAYQAACRVLAVIYADHPDFREEWRV